MKRDNEERLSCAQGALNKLKGLADLIFAAGQGELVETVNWCGVGELLEDLHDDLKAVLDPEEAQHEA